MGSARATIRKIIFAFTGLVTAALLLRLFLVLFNASEAHVITELIFGLTDPLLSPFNNMFAATGFGVLQVHMEIVVAVVFYIFVGIFVSSILTLFLQDKPEHILSELLDLFFKLAEFILLARLVFRLFGIPSGSLFVDTIYGATGWVAGLLPTVDILGGVLEFSTLFILVAVVVLDLVTEGAFEGDGNESVKTQQTHTTVIAERPVSQPQVQQNRPQNITINVPVPRPQQAAPRQQNLHQSKQHEG